MGLASQGGEIIGTQHDAGHFDIAVELAKFIAERK